ncbi:GFA family protein [Pseudochrobactrum kiredjianiae]|uniref:GFA family protein n=1 Tax=Pseudochrobactrum kiredjianiae TaxID=386305 RepID=A0ABW3V634_9HYPH|nr:GFA family protein [Pseudochrobactrum kiredjianiae]MDM7849610.1 GFA family protein [Pseudochrobactrum kiredjianiae]
MMKTYSGGCLCGSIRFEAQSDPLKLKPHSCCCKNCQQHTGALTAVWVEFAAQAVRWTGEGGEPASYRSSHYSKRAFCSACGSSIGAIDDEPVIALLLGCIDDNNQPEFAPEYTSFEDMKPDWWHPDRR